MSNENERMKILEMVEKGVVSTEEALKLFEAIEDRRSHGPFGHRRHRGRRAAEERIHVFACDAGRAMKDVGTRMAEFYKEVEPKIKKASQHALEKAAAALEQLAASISESLKEQQCCEDEECSCNKPEQCCNENTPGEN